MHGDRRAAMYAKKLYAQTDGRTDGQTDRQTGREMYKYMDN